MTFKVMKKKVSVIVPVYNAEKYLAECIESILCQDYPSVEVVLVNDGSSDGSLSVCRRYECERVVVVDKPNGGVSSARNVGLLSATGSLLAFVDSDDRLTPDSISLLADALDRSGADLACGSLSLDYGGRLVPHPLRLGAGEYEPEELLGRFIDDGTMSGFMLGSVCASLYKKEIVDRFGIRFSERIRLNEDGLFNLEYVLRAKKVAVIPDFIYNYRQYGGSSSKKTGDLYRLNLEIKRHICSLACDGVRYDFGGQLQAREVVIALWEIINLPVGTGIAEGRRFIAKCIARAEVREGLKHLDFSRMPRYKQLYAVLIRWRMSLALCLLIKYVQPLVMSRLKR